MMKIFLRRMVLLPRDSGNDLRFSQNGCDTSRFREVLSFCFLKKNRLETSLISICFKQKWKRDRVFPYYAPCIYCHLHIQTVLQPFPCLQYSSYPQINRQELLCTKSVSVYIFSCVLLFHFPMAHTLHIASFLVAHIIV